MMKKLKKKYKTKSNAFKSHGVTTNILYMQLGSARFAGLPRRWRITGEVCVYDNYTYWGLRPQWLWVGFGARTKIS